MILWVGHPPHICILEKVGESRSGTGTTLSYYNFCRIHGALRVTPAIEAGITDHLWAMDELIGA
jgi:hypothetical protein